MSHRPARRYDRYTYEQRTDQKQHELSKVINLALRCGADPAKEQRLKEGKCLLCYYREGGRVGAAAITTTECCFCESVLQAGNTAVDLACQNCAVKHGVCRECGADLNLKLRRKVSF